MSEGIPAEEYKIVCEFMRSYATLRFLRLTILLGATGGLIGALLSEKVQNTPAILLLLKSGGLALTAAFGAMDHAASVSWRRMRDRANALAARLQFAQFPATLPWSPVSSEGASRYPHLFLSLLWVYVLVRGSLH